MSRRVLRFQECWDLEKLFDYNRGSSHQLPGVNLEQWLRMASYEYDDIDRMYIDFETQGGE